MSRSMIVSMVASAAIAVLSQQAQAEVAAPGAQSLAPTAELAPPPGITTQHKLITTYFGTSYQGIVLSPNTLTPVGAQGVVNCANAAGCTVSGDFWAQFGSLPATQAFVAICMKVDSTYVDPCTYTSVVPKGTGYFIERNRMFTSVPLGAHTVDMIVFSDQASTVYNIGKEIQLFKP
jgi:hypothetical protein